MMDQILQASCYRLTVAFAGSQFNSNYRLQEGVSHGWQKQYACASSRHAKRGGGGEFFCCFEVWLVEAAAIRRVRGITNVLVSSLIQTHRPSASEGADINVCLAPQYMLDHLNG